MTFRKETLFLVLMFLMCRLEMKKPWYAVPLISFYFEMVKLTDFFLYFWTGLSTDGPHHRRSGSSGRRNLLHQADRHEQCYDRR